MIHQIADNIPGQPHRWADAISAWAHGHLVQWRYVSPKATGVDWRDCPYPSRGRPNFEDRALEFRVAGLTIHVAPLPHAE